MKNTIKTTLGFIAIGMTLTFFGCKKDNDTNLNYQSPGNYGNASLVNTVFKGQLFQPISGGNYELTLNDPSITQTVLNNSSVTVYIQGGGGPDTVSWYVLPATIQAATFTVSFGIGKVVIVGSTEPAFCIPNVNVRVVIVSTARKAQYPFVNFDNYIEVKKAFHLKD